MTVASCGQSEKVERMHKNSSGSDSSGTDSALSEEQAECTRPSKRRRKTPALQVEPPSKEDILSEASIEAEPSSQSSPDAAENPIQGDDSIPETTQDLSGDALRSYLCEELLGPCDDEFNEIVKLCDGYDL
ncbi:serine peptidase [Perkinsela sp. CCAP 1560/4]|nr:serine peptidase [Perkinsela sp. CCAP 1560/4]|eukprot:KNH09267.1 serine peptidase [Perkinsela sp. CCAP 1560/4]